MSQLALDDESKIEKNRRKKKKVNYKRSLKHIEPITKNQEKAYHSYFGGQKNVLLHGVAGTGKTFISLYFALSELMSGRVEKIIIVRSIVQTREIGFMPGDLNEKMSHYQIPYSEICDELLQEENVYKKLKAENAIEFHCTSFMRGTTFDNAVVLVDEVQNMSDHEISTVLTRIGENTRLIVCGDGRQDDLTMSRNRNQKSGIENLIECTKRMRSMDHIEFGVKDIVRSGFVKEYLVTRINLGLD